MSLEKVSDSGMDYQQGLLGRGPCSISLGYVILLLLNLPYLNTNLSIR